MKGGVQLSSKIGASVPILFLRKFVILIKKKDMFNSNEYWENRYKSGLTSGNGSYGFLADYKAEIINSFIEDNNINSLLEYGCGDGNQLSKIKCKKIIGVDVSNTAIEKCKILIPKGIFQTISNDLKNLEETDLLLSLDVIYHLIDDEIYNKYIKNIVNYGSKFLIIYAANFEDDGTFAKHVKPRKFTNDQELNSKYELIKFEKNKYPSLNHNQGSFSDWFFYKLK